MSDINGHSEAAGEPEDHQNPAGHEEHDKHVHAFAIPLEDAYQAMHQHHEQANQHAELWSVRIDNFLDALNVDQTLVLRRILNMDTTSAWNMYWDGQLTAMLRLIHHVDPDNGKPDPRIETTS